MENVSETFKFEIDAIIPELPKTFIRIELCFLVVISSIGLPGNTLIIILQAKNRNKTTTDYLILNMAVVELIYCSVVLPVRMLVDVPKVWKDFVSDSICQFEYFWLYTLPLGSAWFLGAIAVDRYIKTCKPLNTSYTVSTAKKECIIISAMACLMGFPSTQAYIKGESTVCIIKTEFEEFMIGMEIVSVITINFVFGIFIFTYSKIWITLRKRKKIRQQKTLQFSNKKQFIHSITSFRSLSCIKQTQSQIVHDATATDKSAYLKTKDHAKSSSSKQDSKVKTSYHNKADVSTRTISNLYRINRKSLDDRAVNKITLIMFLLTIIYAFIWTIVAGVTLTRRQGGLMGSVLDSLAHTLPMLNCICNPIFFFLMSSKFRASAKKLLIG